MPAAAKNKTEQEEDRHADTNQPLAGLRAMVALVVLGRVCKSRLVDKAPHLELKRMMRLRRKVKELLPKIAEVLISIEIDSLERQ